MVNTLPLCCHLKELSGVLQRVNTYGYAQEVHVYKLYVESQLLHHWREFRKTLQLIRERHYVKNTKTKWSNSAIALNGQEELLLY